MANQPIEQDATPRLNTISEELHKINTEIIANLEVLPEQTELVERLIRRCDGIALDLDAIQMELRVSTGGTSAGEKKSPEPSADGSGIKP